MKNFDNEYNEIIANCKDQIMIEKSLAKARKKKKLSIVVTVFLIIILVLLAANVVSEDRHIIGLIIGVCFAFVIALLIVLTLRDKKFRLMYKNTLVSQVIKAVDKNLSYLPLDRFPASNFNASPFYSRYDSYWSEDLIRGQLENGTNILMGEVVTKKEETYYNDGHRETRTVIVFQGVIIEATLPTEFFSSLSIVPNSKLRELNKKRVEMDSAVFEKYFDLMANNKMEAMKLFTPEILELFEDFIELKLSNFALVLNGKKLYLKYKPNHEYLEMELSDKILTRPYVRRYFDDVYTGINLVNKIAEQLKYLEK